MTTNFIGTNYYAGCGNPFGQSVLTVTFPAAGGLFPFDLLYFHDHGRSRPGALLGRRAGEGAGSGRAQRLHAGARRLHLCARGAGDDDGQRRERHRAAGRHAHLQRADHQHRQRAAQLVHLRGQGRHDQAHRARGRDGRIVLEQRGPAGLPARHRAQPGRFDRRHLHRAGRGRPRGGDHHRRAGRDHRARRHQRRRQRGGRRRRSDRGRDLRADRRSQRGARLQLPDHRHREHAGGFAATQALSASPTTTRRGWWSARPPRRRR